MLACQSLSGELEKIAQDIYKKVCEVEGLKYDIEFNVRQKDFEVRVNRGHLKKICFLTHFLMSTDPVETLSF